MCPIQHEGNLRSFSSAHFFFFLTCLIGLSSNINFRDKTSTLSHHKPLNISEHEVYSEFLNRLKVDRFTLSDVLPIHLFIYTKL